MKNKNKNAAMVIFLFILGFVVIGSLRIEPIAGKSAKVQVQMMERFSGHSEYYYKPAGDTRIWHVVNIYSELKPMNDNNQNMSFYKFNSDSVLVINQFAVIPDQYQPEIDAANVSKAENNINN